jgi:hypothetical protein
MKAPWTNNNGVARVRFSGCRLMISSFTMQTFLSVPPRQWSLWKYVMSRLELCSYVRYICTYVSNNKLSYS